MRYFFMLPLLLCAAVAISAQTTRDEVCADLDKAGGVYYAYPTAVADNTPAPKGFIPFYISHYGRHGSRYLISDQDYLNVLTPLRRAADAGKLTPLGRQTLDLAEKVRVETYKRGGDLAPLGVRQQKGIAKRMVAAYPEVFAGNPALSAKATTVMRVALSMDAFAEGLKEERPGVNITRESSERYMDYLNYHSPESNAYTSDSGPWREEFRKFRNSRVKPDRLMEALFNDPAYVYRNVNPEALMWALYWLAVDQQNVETPGSFYEVFTPDEMFSLWEVVNYDNYVRDSAYPGSGGLVVGNASNLLRNIIESTDAMIATGGNGADFRFGHDGNIIPLAAIMRLDGAFDDTCTDPAEAHKVFANFKIAPMAANIQMVFFRDRRGEVLVKFLLNEKETAIPVDTDRFPYYRWEDVRNFLTSVPEMQ